jgi:hypothetical protein
VLGPIALAFALLSQQSPTPSPLSLAGDPDARIAWSRSFASDGDDWINDIVPLSGGRYLAPGYLDRGDGRDWRALAAVLTDDGIVLAAHEYGRGGGIDAFWTGAEAGDGRLVLAGFTTRIGAGGIDGYALFADAGGKLLGERPFGDTDYDRFTDMAAAPDGWLFLGHSVAPGTERRRLFLVKTDRAGAPLWQRIIDGADAHSALYIEAAADGGFVIAGNLVRGQAPATDSDMLVMKVDAEGRELWRRTIGTPEANDVNHGMTLLPDGRIVVTAYSKSWGARDNDILAAVLSPAGEVLSREMLGGAGDDRPILAHADSEGRVWIAGQTTSVGAGGIDMLLARLDAKGRFDPGVITLGSAADDNGTAALPIGGGAMLVAGYSNGAGRGQDAFVARIDGAKWQAPNPAFTRRSAG